MPRPSSTLLTHLLLKPKLKPAATFTICRSYAIAPSGKAGRPEAAPADPRNDIIRRTLFPERTSDIHGAESSPTGVHRPDVEQVLELAIPSAEAHETIERAWKLHKREMRLAREDELKRKYASMLRAVEVLKELDPVSYAEACRGVDSRRLSEQDRERMKAMKRGARKKAESRIEGLFPREMRIPTDTPRRDGWNHGWTAL
ncbi:MRP-L28 domain-containing protein [Ceratobasidium theobromae]|uniref:Large ribosomal subunit protein mL40 n=1 Tax=Ceratobasidium theobromae TaxID=1582974 RepID=A0A5N5QTR1_9AGAM|nr:MRP-L28 domain-containing protein [Ceratobasidium theobromae]